MTDWRSSDAIDIHLDGELVICTIDRPDRAGSLRTEDMQALRAVFDQVGRDGAGRAVLLKSKGPHFCAGADLVAGNQPEETKPQIGHMLERLRVGAHGLVDALWKCRVPVVASVQGRAAGLGVSLALAADVAVAARSASFSCPFIQRGFTPDSGSTWLLPRVVGLTRAKAILLQNRVVDADTAFTWGMVSEVVEESALERASREVANELAAGPTFVLELTKGLLHRHISSDLEQALVSEAAAVELSIRGVDFREGMRAMREKRSPHFRGR